MNHSNIIPFFVTVSGFLYISIIHSDARIYIYNITFMHLTPSKVTAFNAYFFYQFMHFLGVLYCFSYRNAIIIVKDAQNNFGDGLITRFSRIMISLAITESWYNLFSSCELILTLIMPCLFQQKCQLILAQIFNLAFNYYFMHEIY